METEARSDRYTIISSDTHAGGSHAMYREFLEKKYLDDFDAWRGRYENPFSDLGDQRRLRNWDDDMRNGQQDEDGVAGEVIFPNTVPPFFPTGAPVAPPPMPEDYELRLAGIRAHNRWLVDFCAEQPDRRAGVGQIFVNDVDDAVADVRWIAEHGLRGGCLLPAVPVDRKDMEPLHSAYYEPLWQVCAELGVVVNHHAGGGSPDYGRHPASGVLWIAETQFFSRRALTAMLLSGVFERHPTLRFVLTEQGSAWLAPHLDMLDSFHAQMRSGRIGELGFPAEVVLPLTPREYVERNVWLGISFPSASEIAARDQLGTRKLMWGNDYPHHEGTFPFTREHLRRSFHDVPEDDLRRLLSGNIAALYGFDLDRLAPVAERVGPTLDEVHTPLDEVPAGATSPSFFRD
jgi:predicted TIM-barrel fold metal-dependent hydrolase